jgi:hypothetical protein
MALDLASPLIPGGFMLLASLGSVSRAMVGMSAGATGAALTQHFASGRNAADISAKADSRERATSIVGSLLGMAVTQHLAGAGVGGLMQTRCRRFNHCVEVAHATTQTRSAAAATCRDNCMASAEALSPIYPLHDD